MTRHLAQAAKHLAGLVGKIGHKCDHIYLKPGALLLSWAVGRVLQEGNPGPLVATAAALRGPHALLRHLQRGPSQFHRLEG